MFWIKYHEKLAKNYKDKSELYLDDNNKEEIIQEEVFHDITSENKESIQLYTLLKKYAKQLIDTSFENTKVTKKMYTESAKIVDKLYTISDIKKFNMLGRSRPTSIGG